MEIIPFKPLVLVVLVFRAGKKAPSTTYGDARSTALGTDPGNVGSSVGNNTDSIAPSTD